MQMKRTPVAYQDEAGNEFFGFIVKDQYGRTLCGPPEGVSWRLRSQDEIARADAERFARMTMSAEDAIAAEAGAEHRRQRREAKAKSE